MTLSRWRRVATGVAAGVIVLSAALIGASFRDDNSGVSVASDLRPSTTVIPVPEDDAVGDDGTKADASDAEDSGAAVTVIEPDDLPDSDASDEVADTSISPDSDEAGETTDSSDPNNADDTASETNDSNNTTEATDTTSETGDSNAAEASETNDSNNTTEATDTTSETDDSNNTTEATDTTSPAAPVDGLGTGGGVDNAECALDRLVIYAGARRGGVAGSIRTALARAGFGAGCSTPVTVLASNCPLQFAGVLGAGSGYDPNKSFVASSPSVDRDTMTAVMSTVGYSGSEINILNFSFINPDKPGEQWMAVFIPPSFTGWENLASRAGVGATASSLCAPSGELVG